mgnify:CR=1 FL=1
MPELPEVETLKRDLQNTVINQIISKIEILLPKMFIGNSADITNYIIKDINRKGKLLIFRLIKDSQELSLITHLKMTGQLVFKSNTLPDFTLGHPIPPLNTPVPNKSTKVIIHFASGDTLFFNDLRTFGYMKIATKNQLRTNPFLANIGVEPFSPDFTIEYLKQKLRKHSSRTIKSFLLDQTIIAGLGNIYTDEALFNSQLHPSRPTGSLDSSDTEKLFLSIKHVLQTGIDHHGASKTSYVTLSGQKGTFLANVKVYQRQNQPCLLCQTPIQKIKLQGRGTHFCPQCQI